MTANPAKTETQLPAATGDLDPYSIYGAAVASQTAPFLKFVKGEFKFGVDNEVLPLGSKLVPNMAELKAGYIKWADGEPIAEKMSRIVEGAAPTRKECGDMDENQWPLDPNGVRADPWQNTNTLAFKCPETDQEFVFTTSSQGGVGAVGKLATSFGRQRGKRAGQLPIVEIEASSYRHKIYGEVFVPVFKIIDWVSEATLVAGGSTDGLDDALNDEVPF